MTHLNPLQLLLAKSLCSCREWLRASATLARCTSSTCVFLRNYAKYMAGEKAKCDADAGRREALESVDSSNACAAAFNCIACRPRVTCACCRYLCDIIADIDGSGCAAHALVAYVKGICLNKQGARRAALAALTHSVTVFPLNWSAWMEILTISKKVKRLWRLPFSRVHVTCDAVLLQGCSVSCTPVAAGMGPQLEEAMQKHWVGTVYAA